MKCVDCQDFRIRQQPLRTDGEIWDFGLAECRKHNLVVDFANRRDLNRLECVEGGHDDNL